jgi:hypothetical protein
MPSIDFEYVSLNIPDEAKRKVIHIVKRLQFSTRRNYRKPDTVCGKEIPKMSNFMMSSDFVDFDEHRKMCEECRSLMQTESLLDA